MWSKSLEILNPYEEVCKSLEKEAAEKAEKRRTSPLTRFLAKFLGQVKT